MLARINLLFKAYQPLGASGQTTLIPKHSLRLFSAAGSVAIQQARKALEATTGIETVSKSNAEDHSEVEGIAEQDSVQENQTLPKLDGGAESSSESSDDGDCFSAEEDHGLSVDPRARVLSVLELEDLLLTMAPPLFGYFSFSSPEHLFLMTWQTLTIPWEKLPQNSASVSLDTLMLENPARSILFSEKRKSVFRRLLERPSTSRPSICLIPLSSVTVLV